MRGAAPAVLYPVAPHSRRLARLLLPLAAAQVLALLLLATLSQTVSAAAIAAQGMAAVLVCVALWHFWRVQPCHALHWDGQLWHVQAAPDGRETVELKSLDVVLDTQRSLLLQCRQPGHWRNLWLWLDADNAPQHWHALRCALYFSQDNPGVARRLEEALP